MNFYPDGLGEPGQTGDALLNGPVYTHGNVWYCDSLNVGGDAAQGPSNKEDPFEHLAYAVTRVAAGDIIVLAPTHNESITTTFLLPSGSVVVGAGETLGVPDARLTVTAAVGAVVMGLPYCQMRNIHFCASTATPNAGYYLCLGEDARVLGCQFDVGAFDTTCGVEITPVPDTWACYVEECKFLVTSQVLATGSPPRGLYYPAPQGAEQRYVRMRDVTFDGATYGFSVAGCDFSAVALLDLHAWDITLLNGADFLVHANTVGFLHNFPCTGGAKVVW